MGWAKALGLVVLAAGACSGVDPKGLVLGPLAQTNPSLWPYLGTRGRYADGHEEWVSLGAKGWQGAQRWLGGFNQESPGQAYGFRWVTRQKRGAGGPTLWQLHWEGVPVEGAWAQVVEGAWVSATKPPLDFQDLPLERPPFTLTPQEACLAGAQGLKAHVERCRVVGQVYQWVTRTTPPAEKGLRPAFKAVFSAHPEDPGPGPVVPKEVLVDGQTGHVLGQKSLALHLEGVARLWPRNVVASPEGETLLPLPGLRPPGQVLSSDLFDVRSCNSQPLGPQCDGGLLSCALNPSCGRLAYSPTPPDFTAFTYDTPAYDEVVAYHSVARALKWHMGLLGDQGAGVWGNNRATLGLSTTSRLEVYTRTPLCTSSMGCLYENAGFFFSGLTGYGPPQILVGPGYGGLWPPAGGGRRLRNLGKDSDVVTHEVAHLVLFRTLVRIAGQTGVLHEGTADYFTYAQMGSNKLAEGVTPDGQPLRWANLTGLAKDYIPPENSNVAAHRFGVFWSSALLDLRQSLGPWQGPYALADKVVWDAIDYMKPDAGYYDAIGAIAQAATQLAQKEGRDGLGDRQKIFATFHRFGFLTTNGQDGHLPPNAVQNAAPQLVVKKAPDSSSKSSKSSSWCGVVAIPSASHGPLFLFLMPLFPVGVRTYVRLKNRSRRKRG